MNVRCAFGARESRSQRKEMRVDLRRGLGVLEGVLWGLLFLSESGSSSSSSSSSWEDLEDLEEGEGVRA